MKHAMPFSLAACLLALALGFAQVAMAAAESFVILPFTVNAPQSYGYLSKAVPSTMQARLHRNGVMEARSSQVKATSQAEAVKAMKAAGADYAVWGSVSVMGTQCTLEVHSVSKTGQTWSRTEQTPVSNLTAVVQQVGMALGREALGVSGARPGMSGGQGKTMVNQMNPGIVVNETGQQQVYLNPQFRYQGAGAEDGSRIRSQRLDDSMVDMAVGDFNGDGKNEVAVLHDHELVIYSWGNDGRLKPLDRIVVSRSNLNFSMRAIDLNRDRAQELVIATFEEERNRPYSYIYSFRGNKLREYCKRMPYFVSVLDLPPSYQPTLVGQKWDSIKLFAPGVYLMEKRGDSFEPAGRISTPKGANVFNLCYIPAGKNGSSQTLMLMPDERLKVFQGSGDSAVHTTMERFSGSATGMEHYKGMPGVGVDRTNQLPSKYFAPMRMIVADLGKTGDYVVMVNKPVSTAAQLFERYRYFPQGEVHALYWDGVGMALKWKTRRIRGSVASIDLADVNNDGVLDLVVGINSSSDLGIGSRRCIITAYPLDVSATDPNVPADLSDFEVRPNR